MTNPIPCVTDSDEWRFDAEPDEPDSLLTLVEQRLEWICDVWRDALEIDTADEWRDVRMMLHGATLALNHCVDRYDDRMAISLFTMIAFDHSIECINAGKFEGA